MKIKYFNVLFILFLLYVTPFTYSDFTTFETSDNIPKFKNNEVVLFKQTNFKTPFYLKHYTKNSTFYTYYTNNKDEFIVASAVYFTPRKINNNNNNIVVFAHGTIGINKQCGIESNLGLITQYIFIKSLLKAGYNVIAPNYRGIGESNTENLYLNAQESGEDVLNAAKALISKNYISKDTKIILLGVSQGALATQRAVEIAKVYAPQLNIIGSVQNSPPFNISMPYNEFKKEYLNILQYLLLPYLVSAVVRSNNDISFNDYYKSIFLKPNERGESLKCLNFFKNFLISNPYTLRPTKKAAIAMEKYLNQQKSPKYKTDIPLLLIRGKKDPVSKIYNKNVANNYLKTFCTKGFTIYEIVRNGGHFRLKDIKYSLKWIKDRFAGKPPANSCDKLKHSIKSQI